MSFLTLFLWYNVFVHDHENGRKGANMNPIIFWLAAFILLYYYLLLDAFYTESDLWQRFGERRMLLDENNGQKITKEQIKEADVTPEFRVFGIQTKKEDREEEGILTANLKKKHNVHKMLYNIATFI